MSIMQGPLCGALATMFLYGVICMQTFHYWQAYEHDRKILKCLVILSAVCIWGFLWYCHRPHPSGMPNFVLSVCQHKPHLTLQDSGDCPHSIVSICCRVLSHYAFRRCDKFGIRSLVRPFFNIYSGSFTLHHRAMPVSSRYKHTIYCWFRLILGFICYWCTSPCINLSFVVVTREQFIIAYAVNL